MLTTTAVGRRAAWQLAAEHAHGDVLVVLDQLAQPTVEVIRLLVDAVRRGAVLAAPAIASANATAHGYATTPDGALWPRAEPGGEPDGVALDCLAARPALFASAPAWDAIAGHPEAQLVAHARSLGSLEVVSERAARSLLGRAGTLDRRLYAEPRGRDRRVHRRVRRARPGGQRQRADRRRQRLDRLDPDGHRGSRCGARRPRAHRARAGGGALARPQLRRGRGARRRAVLPRRRRAPRLRAGSSTCGSRSATPAS